MNEPVKLIIPEQSQQLSTRSEGDTLMAIISRAASNPTVDVDKLERLLGMHERIKAMEAERAMNEALARINLPHVKKNGKIPLKDKDGNSKDVSFAKWEDVDTVIRPILMADGLSLSFTAPARQGDGGGASMTGRLSHAQGAYREAQIGLPLDTGPGRNNLQAMGSTISYGKKYLAFMLLNIVTEGEDDDAQAHTAITNEQAVEIDQKLRDLAADIPAFLKHMKAESVQTIAAKDHKKAIDALAAKAKQKAKEDAARKTKDV